PDFSACLHSRLARLPEEARTRYVLALGDGLYSAGCVTEPALLFLAYLDLDPQQPWQRAELSQRIAGHSQHLPGARWRVVVTGLAASLAVLGDWPRGCGVLQTLLGIEDSDFQNPAQLAIRLAAARQNLHPNAVAEATMLLAAQVSGV